MAMFVALSIVHRLSLSARIIWHLSLYYPRILKRQVPVYILSLRIKTGAQSTRYVSRNGKKNIYILKELLVKRGRYHKMCIDLIANTNAQAQTLE